MPFAEQNCNQGRHNGNTRSKLSLSNLGDVGYFATVFFYWQSLVVVLRAALAPSATKFSEYNKSQKMATVQSQTSGKNWT